MRAIIFVNGVVSDYNLLSKWLSEEDHIVCADGGLQHCLTLDLQPDVVVGDMDSVDEDILDQLSKNGVTLERYPRNKDQTDLELAIDRAVDDGADEILMLGALGGRLDQTLTNLLILAQRKWPIPVRLAEGNQLVEIIRGEQTLYLAAQPGSVVSLVPLSERVEGITYSGLEYELKDATLTLGSTRAISNVVVEPHATISIREGLALVTQSIDL